MRPLPLPYVLVPALFLARPAQSEEPPRDDSTKLVPFEKDEIGGHLRLHAGAGYAAPFGHLASGVKSTARSGDGWSVLGDLALGVSRHVMLGAYGEYQGLTASGRCTACTARSYGAGVIARYHPVQGLRFDPYISYGIGFFGLRSSAHDTSSDYHGLEWLRIQAGGIWSIFPQLGLGPYVQVGGGTMLGLPEGEDFKGSYFRVQLGLALALDLPGRSR